MKRRLKAERLTQQILELLHEIGQIHSLTEQQAYRISDVVQSGAREMHFQVQVQHETPLVFTLKKEDSKQC